MIITNPRGNGIMNETRLWLERDHAHIIQEILKVSGKATPQHPRNYRHHPPANSQHTSHRPQPPTKYHPRLLGLVVDERTCWEIMMTFWILGNM